MTLDLGTVSLDVPVSLSAVPGIVLGLGGAGLATPTATLAGGGGALGTLANPILIPSVGTVGVDLTGATLVLDDPPIVSGPATAPSVWLSFTVDADYEMTLEMTDTGALSEMEVWVGPPYTQAGANVRLVAWTGSPVVGLDPRLSIPFGAQVYLPGLPHADFPISLVATLSSIPAGTTSSTKSGSESGAFAESFTSMLITDTTTTEGTFTETSASVVTTP